MKYILKIITNTIKNKTNKTNKHKWKTVWKDDGAVRKKDQENKEESEDEWSMCEAINIRGCVEYSLSNSIFIARSDRVCIAELLHANRVTGCHAQESLSPRFRLSDRIIVRVTSRRGGDKYAFPSVRVAEAHARTCPIVLTSMLLSSKRERERMRIDCVSVFTTRTPLSPTNWSCRLKWRR